MDCIFCNIINKTQPAESIYEDEDFVVFKDIKPAAPVHLLLVPKIHIASVNHLERKHRGLMGDLLLLVKKIAKEHGISDGYKLTFHVGRKGGQIVDHLHLHLIGGWQ